MRVTATIHGRMFAADYSGGAYIDVYYPGNRTHADDVINVWDYAAGEPTIRKSAAAVRHALNEWLKDMYGSDPEALQHDILNYSY